MNDIMQKAELAIATVTEYTNMATERKSIGFNLLKEWDETHRHDLLFQQNFIDSLFGRLEKALKFSYQRINAVIEIFNLLKIDQQFLDKEKSIVQSIQASKLFYDDTGPNTKKISKKEKKAIEQSKKDSDSNLSISQYTKNKSLASDPQNVKTSNLDPLDVYKNSLTEFQNARTAWVQSSQKFSIIIENEILKTILTQDLFSYEKNIKTIFYQLAEMKKLLAKESSKTQSKIKEFVASYQDGLALNKGGARVKKDTFVAQNSFIKHVEYIYDLIKENGIYCVQMWEQVQVLDMKRLHAIKLSFLKYFEMVEGVQGNNFSRLYIKSAEMFKKFGAHDLTNETLSLHAILVDEEKDMIKRRLKKDPSDLKDMKEYFFELSNKSEFLEYFYQKKWELIMGKKFGRSANVSFYLSTDDYVTVFETKKTRDDKLVCSIKVEVGSIDVKPEKNEVELKWGAGGFWNRTKKKKFVFGNGDQLKEFLVAIQEARRKYGKG